MSRPAAINRIIESPLGRLRLVASDGALVCIAFADRLADDARGNATHNAGTSRCAGTDQRTVLDMATIQLTEYFNGQRRVFDLPLRPGGTDFQRRVWSALANIPYGTTCSYAEVARSVKSAGAVRAVGAASGRNPLPVVVPCHRVIGSDGSLTGYSGGLERKLALLRLEGLPVAAPLKLAAPSPRPPER